MKSRSFAVRPREVEQLLWLLAACILVAGYYFVTQRYERKIADSIDAVQIYNEKTLANRKLVTQSTRVKQLREQIRVNVRGVLLDRKQSEATAVLLRDVDDLSGRFGARVISITPLSPKNVAAAAFAPTTGRVLPGVLEDTAIDITLRGHFSDLLAFVSALPRRHVLLSVGDVQFTLSGSQNSESNKPLLEAKMRVLIYHPTRPELLGEL